jgi:hypothetical protein
LTVADTCYLQPKLKGKVFKKNETVQEVYLLTIENFLECWYAQHQEQNFQKCF